MSMKRLVHRALVPVLTLLVAVLGTAAGLSMARTQRVEAFGCNSGCSGLHCSNGGQCLICDGGHCAIC